MNKELEPENETVELSKKRYLKLIDESQKVEEVKQIFDESEYEYADITPRQSTSESDTRIGEDEQTVSQVDGYPEEKQGSDDRVYFGSEKMTTEYSNGIKVFRRFSLFAAISSLTLVASSLSLLTLDIIPLAGVIVLVSLLIPTSILFLTLWRDLDD